MVLGSLTLYQRFEKRKIKIFYSPETIKIRFICRQNPQDFGGPIPLETKVLMGQESPAPPKAELGEQSSSSENFEFVSSNLAPGIKLTQTFTIILPNLIHKSKKRNLKR